MEIVHGALDVIGMIPALGNIADGINAAIYLAQGDLANAALSAVSLIPMAGAVAALGKIMSKSDGLVKGVLKYGDDLVEGVAKYGDEVAEGLAKHSDEASDVLSSISRTDDKVGNIVENCTDGVHCFIAGTLVLTTDGYKKIEDVEKGDKVIATEPETGETAVKEVLETYVNETDELIHLTVNSEEITTTPTHMFFVPQKGWTQAIDLRAGDILVLVNGEYVIVEKTQHEILEEPVTVYNFEVKDFHTYHVGEQGVLVHNKCKPKQVHHFATNKSKKYTHQFESITDKYGLKLDDDWNKELMPHQGRHPNAYHEYVLDNMQKIDKIAKGNTDEFLKLFGDIKKKIIDNPDMLYRKYWRKIKKGL